MSGSSSTDLVSGVADAATPQILWQENGDGSNPAAKNPRSSAMGNAQFLAGTWLPLIRQAHPELAGQSDAQLLALRADPGLSEQMAKLYAQQNGKVLAAAGLPVNTTTLRAAHALGPGGSQALLRADPQAPSTSFMSQQVLAANPQYQGKTAAQIQAMFGSGGPSLGGAPPKSSELLAGLAPSATSQAPWTPPASNASNLSAAPDNPLIPKSALPALAAGAAAPGFKYTPVDYNPWDHQPKLASPGFSPSMIPGLPLPGQVAPQNSQKQVSPWNKLMGIET
jgi:hypothetical protein